MSGTKQQRSDPIRTEIKKTDKSKPEIERRIKNTMFNLKEELNLELLKDKERPEPKINQKISLNKIVVSKPNIYKGIPISYPKRVKVSKPKTSEWVPLN